MRRESNFTRALASFLALHSRPPPRAWAQPNTCCFYHSLSPLDVSTVVLYFLSSSSFTSGGRGAACVRRCAGRSQGSHRRHTGGTEASACCCKLQVLSGAELHVAGACSSMADRRIQVRTEKAIRELVEVECSFFYFLFLFPSKKLL